MYHFRQANPNDQSAIWQILQQAILRRKLDGSQQWQDGYPNEEVVAKDIERGIGYVLEVDGKLAGYAAILANDEPAYDDLKGTWLTNGDFLVLHRLAVAEQNIGQGIAQKILSCTEDLALQQNIHSIKADTNFDNNAMLYLFEKLGYTYCGEVTFRGGKRKAYEKVLR